MRPTLRVALLATVVDFGGIERVLLNLLEQTEPEIQIFPILFTRLETRTNYFLERVKDLEIPYATIFVNVSRYKYLNPLKNILEVIARFRGEQFDLIHTHGYRADLIGLVASKYFRLPIISTCHGFISIDRNLSFYNKLDIFILKYFNRVIAVSDKIKWELVAAGVDDKKIQVITNAVRIISRPDTTEIRKEIRSLLGICQEDFVFGFVGRLSEEKGVGYLLKALKQGLTKANPWHLVLVGDGPQRALLEQTVRAEGLFDQVHFAGFQNDAAGWYRAMDAFVLPSLTEGTPMALLEAMANGIPAIATAVGGVPALLSSGENGILVPPADPIAILEAMRSVAGDHQLRARLSVGAIRTIQRDYDVKKWEKKFSEVYNAMGRVKPLG